MPIYLWDDGTGLKILTEGGAIAIHENCCCGKNYYCTVEFMAMYDCDTGAWVEDSEGYAVSYGYIRCTTIDMTSGWTGPWTPGIVNPFTCPTDHTCCLLGLNISIPIPSCEISTPQGTYCDSLGVPPLPDRPASPTVQDLKDYCPCYADCPSDNCYPSQPHCLSLTILGNAVSVWPWIQIWENIDGNCSHGIGCLWLEGGFTGGLRGWEYGDIECVNGLYKVRLETALPAPGPYYATYQKSASGGVAGLYFDIENSPPQPPLTVTVFDDGQGGCDSFLVQGDGCIGPDGFNTTPGDTAMNLANWEAAGCPTAFSADAYGTGPFCWDIVGFDVIPTYNLNPLAPVISEYLDCSECLGDPANLQTGSYYIIEYKYDAASTSCSGSTYIQECCLYNGSVFVSATNSINIPTDFFTCLDSGDGRSTKFFGFPVIGFGPWSEPTCGGWVP